MSDRRIEYDDFYGSCNIEYCHVCHNATHDLTECTDCRFLFCSSHKHHNCYVRERKAREEARTELRLKVRLLIEEVVPEASLEKKNIAEERIIAKLDEIIDKYAKVN